MNKPFFVAIEGIDGAGTTTQSQLLVDWMVGKGIEAVRTSEPSVLPSGVLLREILRGQMLHPSMETMALLFLADRALHYDSIIRTNYLDMGKHVVCDRYTLSTLAYQGVVDTLDKKGRGGCPLSWLAEVGKFIPRPDLTVYLQVDVDTAMDRIKNRKAFDIYEREDFLNRVLYMYEYVVTHAAAYIGDVLVVDGRLGQKDVHQAVCCGVAHHFHLE
jgi:dTMP kinase